MSDLAVVLSPAVPAVALGASGFWLLQARYRWAGMLLLATAIGVLSSVAARLAGADVAAQSLMTGSLLLPGSLAVLAYPRPSIRHAVEFCLWVVVAGAGVIATVLALDAALSEALITIAAVTGIALVAHGWWVLETGEERDREAILWLGLAALVAGLLVTMLGLQFGVRGLAVGAIPAATVGPAMVVGVRRPDVTDVRSLVVSVVVLAVVALTYFAVFTAVGATFEPLGADDPSPVAYAFVGLALAAGFHPPSSLRGVVDELLFGERPDPLVAATAVVDRAGDDPVLALRAIRRPCCCPTRACPPMARSWPAPAPRSPRPGGSRCGWATTPWVRSWSGSGPVS
ncbi:MAG: hypothetical protein R2746_17530 [Acidimicrobiales bacterium]